MAEIFKAPMAILFLSLFLSYSFIYDVNIFDKYAATLPLKSFYYYVK